MRKRPVPLDDAVLLLRQGVTIRHEAFEDTMTPGRWREIETLFHGALTRPAADRRVFLASACAGDATLCADVQSLLDQPGSTGGLLSTPAALVIAREITNPAE